MTRVLIIGATSGIASACARSWAEQGDHLYLAARNGERLNTAAQDLRARGAASVASYTVDVRDRQALEAALDECFDTTAAVDIVLVAHGTLPCQSNCEQNTDQALAEFDNNATATIGLLTLVANRLEAQGSGQLVYISSVAGDRGRPSNYLYGSAKAAVNVFCEGLRGRLFHSGVGVLVVKPGFVTTAMTRDLDLPAALTVEPEVVARDILKAIGRRRHNLYTPWFWRWVMLLIRLLPTSLYKRLKL